MHRGFNCKSLLPLSPTFLHRAIYQEWQPREGAQKILLESLSPQLVPSCHSVYSPLCWLQAFPEDIFITKGKAGMTSAAAFTTLCCDPINNVCSIHRSLKISPSPTKSQQGFPALPLELGSMQNLEPHIRPALLTSMGFKVVSVDTEIWKAQVSRRCEQCPGWPFGFATGSH